MCGSGDRRMVAYLPGLRSVVHHFRSFSSHDETSKNSEKLNTHDATCTDSEDVWEEVRYGPLASPDHRFPFPGKVGPMLASPTESVTSPLASRSPLAGGSQLTRTSSASLEPDILTAPLPDERRVGILQTYLSIPRVGEVEQAITVKDHPNTLECQALDCPKLLRNDFQSLFPNLDLGKGQLTVITLSQRTENDMTGWSPDLEDEREVLMEQFVMSAHEICEVLIGAGFWADFIDPSSGQPYMGAHANDTMFETDERYKHFGFEVEDLGCCKVIRHHLWGTHAYVGCIFTNCELKNPLLSDIMKIER